MIKCRRIGLMLLVLMTFSVQQSHAQIAILEIIKAGVKKVIKAIDLKIQREQNKVIWLQNAQKTLENTMSQLRLDEITDWVGKQRDLYRNYYDELAKVKSLITQYQRIREVTNRQVEMVSTYQRVIGLFRSDKHFTVPEIEQMVRVYVGMLDESIKQLDQITMAIGNMLTTMSDAERLTIINQAAEKLDELHKDLQQFTNQNRMLSLQRAKDAKDVQTTKTLYGIK